MPRKARVVVPGFLHHVTQRGNYRQVVFDADGDWAVYLSLIEKYRNKYGVDIFAYCLMDNHVLFLVRPWTRLALGEMFCGEHQKYSCYYHQKSGIKGHLWQERYYSCLVERVHTEMVVRYIERNPEINSCLSRLSLLKYLLRRLRLGSRPKARS